MCIFSASQTLTLGFHSAFPLLIEVSRAPPFVLLPVSCIIEKRVVISTQGDLDRLQWSLGGVGACFHWMVHRHYAGNWPEEAHTPGQGDNSRCDSPPKDRRSTGGLSPLDSLARAASRASPGAASAFPQVIVLFPATQVALCPLPVGGAPGSGTQRGQGGWVFPLFFFPFFSYDAISEFPKDLLFWLPKTDLE